MTENEQKWYGPDAATFGDRLAAAREEAGLEQQDLARRLGIRLDTLRKWEEDRSEPRANRLSMIAGLLNVSIMWLLTGDGDGVFDGADDEVQQGVMISAELRAVRADLLRALNRLDQLETALAVQSAKNA